MRDSFIFYRSFFESFDGLSKKDKLLLFDAICNYALNDIEPQLNGVPLAMFKLLKPQVDANNRRYENGKKGGRPKQNQEETKPKPNHNQDITKPKPNVNANGNVNVNGNANATANATANAVGSGGGFNDEFNIWKMLGAEGIDKVYEEYPNTGGLLLDEVYADIKKKQKKVSSPLAFVMGYAKKVGWDDQAV